MGIVVCEGLPAREKRQREAERNDSDSLRGKNTPTKKLVVLKATRFQHQNPKPILKTTNNLFFLSPSQPTLLTSLKKLLNGLSFSGANAVLMVVEADLGLLGPSGPTWTGDAAEGP